MNLLNMRVGSGLDVHALTPGRPLIIGGVKIAHETGLAGHSDADVLCHAIMDALLGAAACLISASFFPTTTLPLRTRTAWRCLSRQALY